jgi:hypothetical protein
MIYKVIVEFIVYADDEEHATDQVTAILDDAEGLNDRFDIVSVKMGR